MSDYFPCNTTQNVWSHHFEKKNEQKTESMKKETTNDECDPDSNISFEDDRESTSSLEYST